MRGRVFARCTGVAKLIGIAGAIVVGCAATAPTPVTEVRPLVVGTDPGEPPYALRRGDQLVGLEVDFARALADEVGRPLRIVERPLRQLLPALTAGAIDVAMAGITVTRVREIRVAFSDPYFESTLAVLMRRENLPRYRTAASLFESTANVAVIKDTTGDRFVREKFPDAVQRGYADLRGAVDDVLRRRVDMLVHDAPVVLWKVAEREADLGVVRVRLNQEPLAWAFRREDDALRAAANAMLARWRADGTLERTLTRWMPYWQQLAEVPLAE